MNIETLVPSVSDVSSRSSEESHSLLVIVFEVSSNSSVSVMGPAVTTDLNGDDLVSVSHSSDGLGSPVEGPPLSVMTWVVVLDSKSVLVVTDVLVPEESSLAWHDGLDLESNTVSKWVSWMVSGFLVNDPGLVGTVVALVPVDMSVLGVGLSMVQVPQRCQPSLDH
jgi:hypothetical protein